MARRRAWALAVGIAVLAAVLLLARSCGAAGPGEAPPSPRRAPSPGPVEPPPAPSTVPAVDPPPSEAAAEAPVPSATGSIAGVALRLDGVPAAGARLRAAPGGDESRRVVATAAEDGSFRFEGLAPGHWTVACAGGGYGTRLDGDGAAAEAEVVAGGEVRVEVRAQALAVVAGVVTGPDGRPVEGARVRLQCDAFLSPTGGAWHLETRTGGDGAYEIRNASPGEFAWLVAAAEGFATADRKLHDMAPGSRTVVDFALEPAAVLDLVLVAADDGSPVREAFVWIHDGETGFLYDGGHGDAFVPDEGGRVRAANLRPRPAKVQINAKGFVSVPDTPVDPRTAGGPVPFRLVRALAISGRLVREDGTPVEGLEVTAVPEGARDVQAVFLSGRDAYTLADGSFRIEGMPPGRFVVGVFENSVEPIAHAVVESGTEGVLLRLPAGEGPRSVRLRVVGPGGEPVAEFRYREGQMTAAGNLVSSGGGGSHQREASVAIKEDTTAFVEIWDPRDEAGGRLPYGHVFLALPRDAPAVLEVRLPPEQSVEGRVAGPDGRPVEGAAVRVFSVPGEGLSSGLTRELPGTRSGSGGAFRLVGLGEGRVRLRASSEGMFGVPVLAAGGDRGVVLVLTPEAPCELVVLGPDGDPVEGAGVFAQDLDGDRTPFEFPDPVPTDARGRVRLRELVPGKRYRLQVFPPSTRQELLQHRDDDWVPASGTLRLERARTLEGTVRLDGTPPPASWNGWVEAWREGEARRRTEVDAEGRFRLTHLPGGLYEVRVLGGEPPGTVLGTAVAEAGGPPVTVEIPGR